MSRFIRDAMLFVLLQAVLVGGLMFTCYDVRDENPLYAATVIKHRRMAEAPSPRAIFVGGSNLLFGLDSTMIEQQTEFSPVNMGLIGGLRLEYVLNEALAHVRAGDLVVLSIEYNSLNAQPGYSNLEIVLGLAAQRPANIAYLTWPQIKQALDHEGLRCAGIMFRQAVARVVPRREPQRRRTRDDHAVIESVNRFGDLTRYHPSDARLPRNPNNQRTLAKMVPERVRSNIKRINRFVQDCEARGVAVVYAPPPVPRTEFERRRNVARRFDRAIAGQLRAPMLLRPHEVVFNDEDFIGRSYHLRGAGVQRRTQQLIDALNAVRNAGSDDRGYPLSAGTAQPLHATIRPR
jgi:hypothetical protein